MVEKRAFSFLNLNRRGEKPRTRGLTEMRGPYYAPMGKRYLADILETVGDHVDILKFSGGSFSIMPEKAVRELIDLAHDHDVMVSTGGFVEYVLTQGEDAVRQYIKECKNLGFDIVEVSAGFLSVPEEDLVRVVEQVTKAGMKPKPEVGIQFGAGGGATRSEELEAEGTKSVKSLIRLGKRYLEAGAPLLMIESEGITENVKTWRTDAIAAIADEIGLEKAVFEAAEPEVFGWYVKNFGPEVNLFVDHSQVVQLECLRRGIWGEKSLWGRVVTYKPQEQERKA